MVSFEDIDKAASNLRAVAHQTPVLTSRLLDLHVGYRVYCKCENFQRTGSFKIRGAYNAISKIAALAPSRPVLTYSSGNHAQAVALASRLLNVDATIIMPSNAPMVKRRATEEYGASIVSYDPEETTREELASRISHESGLTIIPPYDHPDVIAGQGTVCVEFLDTCPDLDMLLVPCGGGGLLAGTALAASALAPGCHVVGIEPSAADDANRSFKTGTLHTVHNPDTIADGARTPSLGKITFPVIQRYVYSMATVTEDAIRAAAQFVWQRLKIVVEPTGVLGLAAFFCNAVTLPPGARVGVIITGGNVDVDALFSR